MRVLRRYGARFLALMGHVILLRSKPVSSVVRVALEVALDWLLEQVTAGLGRCQGP